MEFPTESGLTFLGVIYCHDMLPTGLMSLEPVIYPHGACSMTCFHECGGDGSDLPFCPGTALTRHRGTAHSRYDLNKAQRVLESGYLARRFVAQRLDVEWFGLRNVELTASPKGASRHVGLAVERLFN